MHFCPWVNREFSSSHIFVFLSDKIGLRPTDMIWNRVRVDFSHQAKHFFLRFGHLRVRICKKKSSVSVCEVKYVSVSTLNRVCVRQIYRPIPTKFCMLVYLLVRSSFFSILMWFADFKILLKFPLNCSYECVHQIF